MKKDKKYTNCGQELSDLLIADDNRLTARLNDGTECEVVGYTATVFYESFMVTTK